MSGHLTDEQLVDLLYGVSQHPHADACVECAGRLRAMDIRRAETAATVPASSDFLAAQRRRIYSRLDEPSRSRLLWAPAALAAAGVLGAVMFAYRPAMDAPRPKPHAAVSTPAQSDAQLFSDVFSMEQSSEPRAAAPIRALIEENE